MESAMAYDMTDDFPRPVPLALAALAIVGWLLVAFFWSQTSDLRAQMDDAMSRAEVARAGPGRRLAKPAKGGGNRRRLQEAGEGRAKGVGDAVAARASAQNELAELTKQISEAKLAVSGAQEEASAKSRDLQAVEAKLKARPTRLARSRARYDRGRSGASSPTCSNKADRTRTQPRQPTCSAKSQALPAADRRAPRRSQERQAEIGARPKRAASAPAFGRAQRRGR